MEFRTFCFFVALISLFFSCENASETANLTNSLVSMDSIQFDSSIAKNIEVKPVFGYRFIINGDFDGDGRNENLVEHYYSGLEKKETNKFFDGVDYDSLVTLTRKKEPFSFVLCDDASIDTLKITSLDLNFGLSYFKNEGNIDGEGGDEVSYVVNWADWSNCNTWHLMTYKNKKWKEIYSFPIWDFQLPDLPETANQYGLFGLEDKVINIANDTNNQRIEKQMNEFKGLVQKLATNKIQVIYRNDEAEEDTMEIDLKMLK